MKDSVIFIFILVLIGSISCQRGQKLDVLIPEIQYMADTMFANRSLSIIANIDSLCAISKEKELWKAVDSLLLIEAKRIEELTQ